MIRSCVQESASGWYLSLEGPVYREGKVGFTLRSEGRCWASLDGVPATLLLQLADAIYRQCGKDPPVIHMQHPLTVKSSEDIEVEKIKARMLTGG